MTYKLIALDVDGTLLNDRNELTERTKRTIRSVHEAGAIVVLCTGRPPANTLPLMEELGLEGIVITHNGATTIRTSDHAVLHQYPFDVRLVEPVVRYCRANGIHYDICTPFHLFTESELDDMKLDMYLRFGIEPQSVEDALGFGEKIVKLTAVGDNEQHFDRMELEWRELARPLVVTRSDKHFIDVMHPDATKGAALQKLAESRGIRREEVLAIGNYFNDVEMIRYAGLGIAMGNSPDGVKAEADAVTGTNNDDGVHEALTRYVLERKKKKD